MYKILIAMFAMFMIAGAAWAQNDDEATRCDYCGMFWDNSSTRIEMDLSVDGKQGDYHFESIGCAFNTMNDMQDEGAKDIKVNAAQILDYTSFGSDREVMLDAHEAWFLVGTSRLAGSMGPFIAAFGSEEVAQEMLKSLGGELMTHDEMVAYMTDDGEAMEDHGDMHEGMPGMGNADAEVWVCGCSGGCCDDIQSDKPGKCSKCGMDLVKKSDK